MTSCEIDFVLDQCDCTELPCGSEWCWLFMGQYDFYGPEWGRLCNASLWLSRITLWPRVM